MYQKVCIFKQKRITVNWRKTLKSTLIVFALTDWSFIARPVHVRTREENNDNKKTRNNEKYNTDLAYGFVSLSMEFLRLIFSSAGGKKKNNTLVGVSDQYMIQHRPRADQKATPDIHDDTSYILAVALLERLPIYNGMLLHSRAITVNRI